VKPPLTWLKIVPSNALIWRCTFSFPSLEPSSPFAAGLLAAEHGLTQSVLDAVDINLDPRSPP